MLMLPVLQSITTFVVMGTNFTGSDIGIIKYSLQSKIPPKQLDRKQATHTFYYSKVLLDMNTMELLTCYFIICLKKSYLY